MVVGFVGDVGFDEVCLGVKFGGFGCVGFGVDVG